MAAASKTSLNHIARVSYPFIPLPYCVFLINYHEKFMENINWKELPPNVGAKKFEGPLRLVPQKKSMFSSASANYIVVFGSF